MPLISSEFTLASSMTNLHLIPNLVLEENPSEHHRADKSGAAMTKMPVG